MRKIYILSAFIVLTISAAAQNFSAYALKRTPVLITNDLSGDVDGLFALVHQLQCRSSDVKGIVGTHLGNQKAWTKDGKEAPVLDEAVQRAHDVLGMLGKDGTIPVVKGANHAMESADKAIDSEGARLIIQEAHKATPERPLYVTVGASLTDVASAWLLDPTISKNIIVVWIGGQEYPFGHPFPEQFYKGDNLVEYNARLDIHAVQTVFNKSDLRLWQIPRDVYRECMYGIDELTGKLAPCGKLGKYLCDKMIDFGSDTYVLGDSPMVLISTLTTTFEPGAASSFYQVTPAPYITEKGLYDFSRKGRDIRVYKTVDTRLLFGDMEAKLQKAGK